MYPTRHAPQYTDFRNLLDYDHHRNLARMLTNRWQDGLLVPKTLQSVRIGPPLEAEIWTYFWQGELWILAGHWVRPGEPRDEFLDMLRGYVRAIRNGEPPC